MILAYQLISRTPQKALGPVLELFSQTGLEVCEGQQYDVLYESRNDITETDYIEMIRLKTAVLLGASLKTGAIIGGASPEAAHHLYQFGMDAGISFQLQDDWLDVFGDAATFGKNIGGDIVTNKKTFLLINALNNLSAAGKKELQFWIDKKDFDRDEKVKAVRNLYEDANVSISAKKRMNEFLQKALLHLEQAGGSAAIQEELKTFAYGLMERSR
ncbi:dimethylallyltransferase [Geofilum rubicundum JCM 15548]|uniref:Dimethylallyltransferase n=1 Tax=Geofilum rubicundum JCM 15548 TaxID=1236989 RepID=A0A0E9LSM7_9BACT|nr:dimethylallyltransferase [Geofilum rubicundum JCM 15548]